MVSAVYTADIRGNLDGGVERGTRYLDNVDLQVAIDADRLIGWHGARVFEAWIKQDIGRNASPSANFSDRYRRRQALTGDMSDNREVVVEAVYNAVIAPWLSVQPDSQYVVNPGGNAALNDAMIIGLRVKIGR